MNTPQSLTCPYCGATLQQESSKTYKCINNHNFDLSKEGYLNLLPVNKKKSKIPGDNDMMIDARRRFLEAGHYDPLVFKTATSILSNVQSDLITVLDAGCGEGYYTNRILEDISTDEVELLGVDISKHAVKLAAKKYKEAFFAVSSVYELPLLDSSIDLILSIFAPIHPVEFYRVQAEGGTVVVVGAGPNHLQELAELIYDEFRPHQSKVIAKMSPLYSLTANDMLEYTIKLDNQEDIINLLKMTPYYWNISKEKLSHIESLETLELTCHFEVLLFDKKAIDTTTQESI